MSEPLEIKWRNEPLSCLPLRSRLRIAYNLVMQAVNLVRNKTWNTGEISRPPRSWK